MTADENFEKGIYHYVRSVKKPNKERTLYHIYCIHIVITLSYFIILIYRG